jgi:hypothetical protein
MEKAARKGGFFAFILKLRIFAPEMNKTIQKPVLNL